MKRFVYLSVLFLTFIIVLVVVYSFEFNTPLNKREEIVIEAFLGLLLFGISFLFGEIFAEKKAIKDVENAIKPSLRRSRNIYESILRVVKLIDIHKETGNAKSVSKEKLETYQLLLIELLYTSDDSLPDWEDFAPEEVSKIRKDEKSKEVEK